MEIFIGIRDNTRQLALDVDMTENELMAILWTVTIVIFRRFIRVLILLSS